MKRIVTATVATAAGLLFSCANLAAAAPVHAAYTCPSYYGTATVKSSVDFANVHRSAGTNPNDIVGGVPGGNRFCVKTYGRTKKDGHYWDNGYGYNGSTKLVGYVADDLLG